MKKIPQATITYLFSRYPDVFATYADAEMMTLAQIGTPVGIASVSPPATSFRHGYASEIGSSIVYAPPVGVRNAIAERFRVQKRWPETLLKLHEEKFNAYLDANKHARDAVFFAERLPLTGVRHLHVHYLGEAAYIARLLKAMAGLTYSITIHDHDWIHGLPHGLAQEVCHEAEFIVCISEYTRGMVLSLRPELDDKLHVVHKGVALERFRQGTFSEGTCPKLLGVGPLNRYKGFKALIEACALLKRRGLAFTCEIIGDGPLAEELLQTIHRLNLEGQVHLTGTLPQESVAQRLRECDIFVLPGERGEHGECDAMPVVLLEAMAAAKPVICSNIGGIEEAVIQDETGLLVEEGNPEALSRAIFTMLADHELRRRLGMMARARVEARFSITETARRLDKLFKQYVSSAPSSGQETQAVAGESGHAGGARLSADIVCVCRQWPDPRFYKLWGEYVAMTRDDSVRVVACRVPRLFKPRHPEIAASIVYLPDAMVEEADWRQAGNLATKVEALRGKLGSTVETEVYLVNARHALALLKLVKELGASHVHALDSEALLVAWIVAQLADVTLSATIENPPTLCLDAVARMSHRIAKGRVATTDQQEKLGSQFEVDAVLDHSEEARKLIDNLVKWKKHPERNEDVGQEWLLKLKKWAASGNAVASEVEA